MNNFINDIESLEYVCTYHSSTNQCGMYNTNSCFQIHQTYKWATNVFIFQQRFPTKILFTFRKIFYNKQILIIPNCNFSNIFAVNFVWMSTTYFELCDLLCDLCELRGHYIPNKWKMLEYGYFPIWNIRVHSYLIITNFFFSFWKISVIAKK